MIDVQAPAQNARSRWPALVFAHGVCLCCLLLQRFGVTVASGSQLFLSLMAIPPLLLSLLLLGQARIRPAPAFSFTLMAGAFLLTSFLTILYPDFNFRLSTLSLSETLILYGVMLIEPSSAFDTEVVLPVFAFWSRVIALTGLAEYSLQFVHVRLFSFAALLPKLDPILMEQSYHVVAPIAYGSTILRSNGFFLLEPSIFSQVMAMAVIVDCFIRRRFLWAPLYVVAMLSAQSGTGPLILALSLLLVGLFSPRQALRAFAVALAGVLAVGVLSVLFPQQFVTLMARASGNDPSSQARFGRQLEILQTVVGDSRLFLGFGPGAQEAFAGISTSSAALKLIFDYGAVGLVAFCQFFIVRVWRSDVPILSVSCLLLYQLGGGYLLFPPLVFLIGLLTYWSRPAAPAPRSRVRPPWAHDALSAAA